MVDNSNVKEETGFKAMLMRTSTREFFKGNILKMLEIYYLKYVRNLYSY